MISPSGVEYEDMTAADVVVVDRDGKKADGAPVKNLPLVRATDEEISNRRGSVNFEWVKGHAGNPFNEAADSLASGYARSVAEGGAKDKLPPEARRSLRGI